MTNRTAKYASAILASVLAGAPLATAPHSAARAADDCLTSPKDETPQGSHWYYRIDRATKRHCWYLRGEGDNLSQTAPSNAPQSAKPIAPKAETATQRSISDAHAELPAQTRIEQPNRNGELTPADVVIGQETGVARIPALEAQPSIVASRWPDPYDTTASTDPAPSRSAPVASASSPPRTQPPAVIAAGQYATADASSAILAYSEPVRLAALATALSLAGIVGGVLFKLANSRRRRPGRIQARPGKMRARRDPVMEPTDDDAIVLSGHSGASPRRSGFARNRTDDRNERVTEFFAQLSKRAPT
jgi:hypothetical protein